MGQSRTCGLNLNKFLCTLHNILCILCLSHHILLVTFFCCDTFIHCDMYVIATYLYVITYLCIITCVVTYVSPTYLCIRCIFTVHTMYAGFTPPFRDCPTWLFLFNNSSYLINAIQNCFTANLYDLVMSPTSHVECVFCFCSVKYVECH